jgi:cytochrome b involved in lipid metabolism
MKFESISEVENFAKTNKKVLVIKEHQVLDVTTFASHHPGGAGLILNY